MKFKVRQEQTRKEMDFKSYAGYEIEHSSATLDNFPANHPTKVPTGQVE